MASCSHEFSPVREDDVTDIKYLNNDQHRRQPDSCGAEAITVSARKMKSKTANASRL